MNKYDMIAASLKNKNFGLYTRTVFGVQHQIKKKEKKMGIKERINLWWSLFKLKRSIRGLKKTIDKYNKNPLTITMPEIDPEFLLRAGEQRLKNPPRPPREE